jgi:hypothetical protein
MKKIIEFLKENWATLLIGVLIIGFVIYVGVLCIRDMSSEEPTVEFTQEEFELELIDVDLQNQHRPEYSRRLSYEVFDVVKDTETYKVYLLTYLVCDNGNNEIWTHVARVKKTDDGWDVDTERVYYK